MSTARLAVFGNPIEHSRSPDIHRQFGETTGISVDYQKILVADGEFEAQATRFLERGTGFNITVPCKHDAWTFVDRASEKANLAEAVNTIVRGDDGLIEGHNTDGGGLIRDILHNLGWSIRDRKVLIIGAGGAVSGVLGDVLGEAPEVVHLTNRTYDKAVVLARRYNSPALQAVPVDAVGEAYDLVINGTSAGLQDQVINVPAHILASTTRCYDMIYGPGVTAFNRWCLARQPNCTTSDGLGMLVEQAALAFSIWFGVDVETAPVINNMRQSLD